MVAFRLLLYNVIVTGDVVDKNGRPQSTDLTFNASLRRDEGNEQNPWRAGRPWQPRPNLPLQNANVSTLDL